MRQSLIRRALAAASALTAFAGTSSGVESASAQTYEAPPVEVPTAPVPQGAPPPPPPAAKPPPPKPAAPTPAPAPKPAAPPATGGAPAAPPATGGAPAAPAKPDDKTAETPPPKPKNNEGVFKISGTKGPGVVGGATTKGKSQPPPTNSAPTTKTAPATKTTKAAPAAKKSSAVVAQWPGFRMTEDGGSEVMVEFSTPAGAPTEHRAAGSVTYVFKGAHVLKHNNQNPLITVHFNTPVARARLVPKKGELHLVVELRADAPPMSGVRAGAEGAGQFFVRFGPGSYLPKEAETTDIPAPTQKIGGEGKKPAPSTPGTPAAPGAPATPGGSKTGPAP